MPLLAVPLDLPPDLAEVRAGDLDGDGRDELILVSRAPAPDRAPDTVTLTVLSLDDDGRTTRRDTITLGNRAMLWDVHGGLWGIDGDGAFALSDGARIVDRPTPLAGLGPATPTSADIADDLDGDGLADVLLYARGRVWVAGVDGSERGSIPVPAEGQLGVRSVAGGEVHEAAALRPPLVVGDVDGDGLRDLILPRGDRATVFLTGKTVGDRRLQLRLPLDLDPRDDPASSSGGDGGPDRRLEGAWFDDLDGDGRLDLLVHQWVTNGSWFGATAEILLARGSGSTEGFEQPQILQTEHAAVQLTRLDFEGDGDQDLLVAEVDVGVGNMARAILAREVQIDASLYVMESGAYADQPVHLHQMSWPLDKGDRLAVEFRMDVTGDGVVDLVTNDGQQRVAVYPGSLYAVADSPVAMLEIEVPSNEDALFVHDLTGDGRGEIVVWGPGQRRGAVLRLVP